METVDSPLDTRRSRGVGRRNSGVWIGNRWSRLPRLRGGHSTDRFGQPDTHNGRRRARNCWLEKEHGHRFLGGKRRLRPRRQLLCTNRQPCDCPMHFVEPSEIIARVTIRNEELLSVSIFVNTPRAPVVIQEWFKTDTRNRFYLSYLKGTVPVARVQFAATLPDAQRRKGFAVRTTCLVLPGGCKKAGAVLPVIRELESGLGPDKRGYRPCGFQVSGNATNREFRNWPSVWRHVI